MCSTSVDSEFEYIFKVNKHYFCFSIVRAFLIEEQRIVAMVMKSKKGTGGAAEPAVQPQTTAQKSK
jgi:hypothetical protein